MAHNKSKIWKIDLEELKKVVRENNSLTAILKHFNMAAGSFPYDTLKSRMDMENIDYSHIPPEQKFKPFPLEKIFVENSTYNQSNLFAKIIKNNLIKYECSICGQLPFWNNKELRLQIDHINGISNDHRLENLRFLCYNCHTQTDTYGTRNFVLKIHPEKEPYKYKKISYEEYVPNVSFKQRKNKIWNIPISELSEATLNNNTFSGILNHFNLPKKGAQYKALKERLYWEDIDFSHIKLGHNHSLGTIKDYVPIRISEEVFVENSTYTQMSLKNRLFKENILDNICSECGLLPEWNNKLLVLQLDHINGIKTDNRIENLRILCPNCHCQTETYCRHDQYEC